MYQNMSPASPSGTNYKVIQDPEHEQEGIDDGRSRQCRPVRYHRPSQCQEMVIEGLSCGCGRHDCLTIAQNLDLRLLTNLSPHPKRRFDQQTLLSPQDASLSALGHGFSPFSRENSPMSQSSSFQTDTSGRRLSRGTLSTHPSPKTPCLPTPYDPAVQLGVSDAGLAVGMFSPRDSTAFSNAFDSTDSMAIDDSFDFDLELPAGVSDTANTTIRPEFQYQSLTTVLSDTKSPSGGLDFTPADYNSSTGNVGANQYPPTQAQIHALHQFSMGESHNLTTLGYSNAQLLPGATHRAESERTAQGGERMSTQVQPHPPLPLRNGHMNGFRTHSCSTNESSFLSDTHAYAGMSLSFAQPHDQTMFTLESSDLNHDGARCHTISQAAFDASFIRTLDNKWCCLQCRKELADRKGASRHATTHDSSRPYICPHSGCEKNYKRQDHLKRHTDKHDNAKEGSSYAGPMPQHPPYAS